MQYIIENPIEIIKLHLSMIVDRLSVLTKLDIRYILESDDVYNIAEALKITKTLTKLYLNNSFNYVFDFIIIIEALKINTSITHLSLEHTMIDKESNLIAELLIVNKTLTHLYLGNNFIKSIGVSIIFNALKINKILTTLDISYSFICKDTAIVISDVLKTNNTLTSLIMVKCDINDESGIIIANSLCYNNSLKELYIYYNEIMLVGYKEFSISLKKNFMLRTFDYDKTYDYDDTMIQKHLSMNKYLYPSVCKILENRGISYVAHSKKYPFIPYELWLDIFEFIFTPKEYKYYMYMKNKLGWRY